jgi:hypothetical protein
MTTTLGSYSGGPVFESRSVELRRSFMGIICWWLSGESPGYLGWHGYFYCRDYCGYLGNPQQATLPRGRILLDDITQPRRLHTTRSCKGSWPLTTLTTYVQSSLAEENLSQCHFVHHKSHMDWPGRKPWATARHGLTSCVTAEQCVIASYI